MEDPDVDNFSSSPHRLPTISASQALQEIAYAPKRSISTGLLSIDRALLSKPALGTAHDGGLPYGQVTEIYGPPGAGKTVFSLNVACNALRTGASVVWIDASSVLHGRRLRDSLALTSREQSNNDVPSEDLLDRFHQFTAPTLPHLLALLLHSPSSFLPKDTSLLVVDAISVVFNHAFAQSNGYDARPPAKRNDVAQWASGRRWSVMADVISAFGKLATTRNIGVLLTNQTTTKVMLESAASLQPAISGVAWDAGIHCRLLLFRDWQKETGDESGLEKREFYSHLRFAAVTKTACSSLDGFGEVVPFVIDEHGLREVHNVSSRTLSLQEPTAPLATKLPTKLKRKRDEIADSASESGDLVSDDEFGWVED